MQKVSWNLRLSEDRQSVSVETLLDGEPKVWAELDASEVQNLIEALGSIRNAMLDEVPRELDIGSRVPVVPDPIWRTTVSPNGQGVHLALRDPRYGWTIYDFPKESSDGLARWLGARK